MKHTDKYGFNLIESSDTFSPTPLNENMKLVESQLDAVRAEGNGGDAVLDQRLQVLEARKLVWGAYTGTGGARTFNLGFAPDLVYVQGRGINMTVTGLATQSASYSNGVLGLTSNGFSVSNFSGGFNAEGKEYIYFALRR